MNHPLDPRTIGERILRDSGLSRDLRAQAVRAKEDLDKRLEGLGLEPSRALPTRVLPGEDVELGFGLASRSAGGAASSVLLDPLGAPPNPRVVPSNEVDVMESEAAFEPSDLIAAQAVTGLATTAAGGTEVRFNVKGLVHVGSGAIGVYWNRPLGASQNFRWAPLAPGLLIPYDPREGLFVGSNIAGGITIGGVLTLAFYKLPPIKTRAERELARIAAQRSAPGGEPGSPWAGAPGGGAGGWDSASQFRTELGHRLGASGSDTTAGAVIGGLGGGTDVTLGSFSDAGAGTQIYLAGSNMPVGGASKVGRTILNAPPGNTDAVWVGETAALAVASNGGLSASGQDTWEIPAGGKLFMLANSGTQILGARYRS